MRLRSWAQDNQEEITCSMRLQSKLNHTHEQISTKYYAAMICTHRFAPPIDVSCLSQSIARAT